VTQEPVGSYLAIPGRVGSGSNLTVPEPVGSGSNLVVPKPGVDLMNRFQSKFTEKNHSMLEVCNDINMTFHDCKIP
jgi:hypothetical protein